MISIDLPGFLMLASNFATPIAVVVGIAVLIRYLNRGDSGQGSRVNSIIREEMTRGIKELNAKLEAVRNLRAEPTSGDREQIVSELRTRLRQEASATLLEELRAGYDKATTRSERIRDVEQQHAQTIGRLREELYALSRRGNLNLSIGIITTISGLFLLGSFVIGNSFTPSRSTPATLEAFLIEFLPRLSIVLLIEVFAYFFLSLYKTTLGEIKYFQNEVTSIESKFMALRLAAQSDSDEHLAGAIDNLAKTERNFMLNKDQTTVDLERARIDQAERSDLTGKLAEFLRAKKEA